MKQLTAVFPKETSTIIHLASESYKSSFVPDYVPEYSISLGGEGGNLDYIIVTGNAQSVMSIIGIVADNGDDSLISVMQVAESGE